MKKQQYIAPTIVLTQMLTQGHLLSLSDTFAEKPGGDKESILGGDGTDSETHPLDSKKFDVWETWDE